MRKVLTFIAAAAVLGFMSLAAQTANANPNTEDLAPIETSHASDCGVASVTLVVPDGTPEWSYRLQIEVDGEVAGATDLVTGPGSSTFDVALDEDQGDGSVTVSYYVIDATEWDIVPDGLNRQSIWPEVGDKFVSFDVATDCLTTVTPEAPSLTQPTCEAPEPVLTVPEVEGVTYSTEGSVTPGHTVTVTATADDGYELAEDAVTEWVFDIAAVPGCDGNDGPPGDDGEDGKDGKDATPSPQEPDDPSPRPDADDDSDDDELPDTGAPVLPLALIGGGLAAAGGVLRKILS